MTKKQLKRGEWLFLRVASYRNREGINDFGLPEEGGANLFLFPFDLFYRELPEVIEAEWEEGLVRLYRPFRNQVGTDRVTEQVMPDVVPGPEKFGPVSENMPALEHLELSHPLGLRADALRVDFVPDPRPAAVAPIINRTVDWIRVLSGQWWIGHARHYSLSPLRNWFSITAEGQPASGFHSFAKLYGGFGTERPIEEDDLRGALRRALEADDAPLPLLLLFDAIYHVASDDPRRALLDAASAIEAAVHHRLEKVANREGNLRRLPKALRSYDIAVLVDRSAKAIAGRSFKEEEPDKFALLKELRTARGNAAHGKPALTSQGVPISNSELHDCLRATVDVVNWLGEL